MKSARLLAASLMLALSVPAWAEPPADIGDSVEALRQKIGAVGVSIAIVEDGRTTLARGWGVRKLGESAPVDAETIFQTGSTGKAMTAAALAVLQAMTSSLAPCASRRWLAMARVRSATKSSLRSPYGV